MQLDHKRALVTGVAVAIVFLGNTLALPALPPGLVARLQELHPVFPPVRLRLLSLGLTPLLSASGLLLLLSGVIDRLRQQREGTATERAAFDQAIVRVALVITLLQGIAYGLYIQSLASEGFSPSLAIIAISVLAGVAALIWLSVFVTRNGIGNGVAWLVLAGGYLPGLAEGLPRELAHIREKAIGDSLPIVGAVLVGLVALCLFYLRNARNVALVPMSASPAPLPPPVPSFPLRINLVGIAPAVVAGVLLSTPAAIAGFLPHPPPWLVPDPPVYWALFFVLTVVLSYALAGLAFDTRRVGPLLERYGYRIDGIAEQNTADYLDALIERRVLMSAVILVGIIAIPGPLLDKVSGISLSRAGFSGEFVLVACAIVLDTVRHMKGLRLMNPPVPIEVASESPVEEDVDANSEHDPLPDEEEDDATGEPPVDDWVSVFESDVELETQLAHAALGAQGIRGVTISNRVIPLAGTFALWEWTVPTYPFLVIHRRLGGGRVVLEVPEVDAARARDVLAAFATTQPRVGAEGGG